MTIDEQVKEYMCLYAHGFRVSHEYRDRAEERLAAVDWTEGERRAVYAGRAAYLAAEQAERARLERCPECQERGEIAPLYGCPDCGGTGRRA